VRLDGLHEEFVLGPDVWTFIESPVRHSSSDALHPRSMQSDRLVGAIALTGEVSLGLEGSGGRELKSGKRCVREIPAILTVVALLCQQNSTRLKPTTTLSLCPRCPLLARC
jgi:hypothetical protein